MFDSSAQRANMVFSQLRTNDVKDPRVLAAVEKIPREQFVPAGQASTAYMEACVPLGHGRAVIDPRAIGKMLQLADVKENDTVLDVGCATGYSTALLAQLALNVVAVESDAGLRAQAANNFASLGLTNVQLVDGPLPEGSTAAAPYDVIFVGGAIEVRPERLLQQLKDGGRLVAIIRNNAAAHARLYLLRDGIISERYAFDAQLPVLPGFEKPKQFVF